MSKSKFTKSQIKELIEVYQVEVKKLAYQTKNVRATIASLKADMKQAPEDAKPKPAKKKAAPKKKVAKKKVAKKVTKKVAKKVTKKVAKKVTKKVAKKAPKKSTSKGKAGRKPLVTSWDTFVMTAIKEANKGMISADLFGSVKVQAKKAGDYKNDAITKTLINRSLQKLVNKQKVLAKFKHAGRGFAYGLPSWGSRGRLKPAYKA